MRSTLDRRADYHGAVLNFGRTHAVLARHPHLPAARLHGHRDALRRGRARDITARTLAELDLRQAALHDPLTGLLNRRGFHQIVVRSWDPTAGGAVLSIDVDRFKGHQRLPGARRRRPRPDRPGRRRRQRHRRRPGFAARTGGDEFVVALPGQIWRRRRQSPNGCAGTSTVRRPRVGQRSRRPLRRVRNHQHRPGGRRRVLRAGVAAGRQRRGSLPGQGGRRRRHRPTRRCRHSSATEWPAAPQEPDRSLQFRGAGTSAGGAGSGVGLGGGESPRAPGQLAAPPIPRPSPKAPRPTV